MIKPIVKTIIVASAAALALAPLVAQAGEVSMRVHRENARINQGVRSGELTRSEYLHLDRSLDSINARRRADLRANGGKLTPSEAAQLNRRENRLSDRIYFDKHNTAEQRGSR